jgi:hypothetical protein
MTQTIFADFNNQDADGCVRLNTRGTLADIARLSIDLREGLRLVLSDGDLTAPVSVRSPGSEGVWRAEILSGPYDVEGGV